MEHTKKYFWNKKGVRFLSIQLEVNDLVKFFFFKYTDLRSVESHTGLKQHEGGHMMTELSFSSELSL